MARFTLEEIELLIKSVDSMLHAVKQQELRRRVNPLEAIRPYKKLVGKLHEMRRELVE